MLLGTVFSIKYPRLGSSYFDNSGSLALLRDEDVCGQYFGDNELILWILLLLFLLLLILFLMFLEEVTSETTFPKHDTHPSDVLLPSSVAMPTNDDLLNDEKDYVTSHSFMFTL